MIFQHPKFQIDTDNQIVYNELGDELRIYGKEYLMLDKLCKDKGATHLELAQILGFGELYRGRGLLEYVQRINAKLKDEVIKYTGENYSIVGELKTAEQIKHVEKEAPKQEQIEEKKTIQVFQKPLSFVVFVGIFIIIAVWFIRFLLDRLF